MGFEIGTDGIGGLVVGFDGSEPSRDALAFASGIARRNQAHLVVVYVPSSIGGAMASLDPVASANYLAINDELVMTLRKEAEGLFAERDIDGEFVVGSGDPAAALEEVAEEQHLDAIVVGRSREHRHRVVGSVPARLLNCARRPIAVVP
jgi:nucleotide-binding universal stress UspA family protein